MLQEKKETTMCMFKSNNIKNPLGSFVSVHTCISSPSTFGKKKLINGLCAI